MLEVAVLQMLRVGWPCVLTQRAAAIVPRMPIAILDETFVAGTVVLLSPRWITTRFRPGLMSAPGRSLASLPRRRPWVRSTPKNRHRQAGGRMKYVWGGPCPLWSISPFWQGANHFRSYLLSRQISSRSCMSQRCWKAVSALDASDAV